jgi:hypothetical protein
MKRRLTCLNRSKRFLGILDNGKERKGVACFIFFESLQGRLFNQLSRPAAPFPRATFRLYKFLIASTDAFLIKPFFLFNKDIPVVKSKITN